MDAIGGYFELELRHGKHYHKGALCLNTARNCFEYILLARKYKKVYIPYYTCEVMLQPLLKHRIGYEFYSINESLEPKEIRELKADEGFLYTNYFGLKQSCVRRLAEVYKTQLIVDNAQAFFAPRVEGIDTFYSPRKFLGVPDGGYLYTDCLLTDIFPRDVSYGRMRHLLQRIDEGAESAYVFFRQNDEELDNNPIREMSHLTSSLLKSIDYEFVREKRVENFIYYLNRLGPLRKFTFSLDDGDVPMVYPFWLEYDIRKYLSEQRIFIAQYWNSILPYIPSKCLELDLIRFLYHLPVDQRLSTNELARVCDCFEKFEING